MSAVKTSRRKATGPPARFIPPMKALAVEHEPSGGRAEWWSEIKFDGYRAIAVINGGRAALWSRNHKPLDYPELLPPLGKLLCANAVLDGEIVALDEQGRSNFQLLQNRDRGERPPIVYYLFDLLHLDGVALRNEPLETRRAGLEELLRKPGRLLQPSPVFDLAPEVVFAEATGKGLEGIVLKRRGSIYESNRRSGAWLKLKGVREQEFVIGGFTPPRNSRSHFGALLVGYFQNDALRYAGKVGTGFDEARLASLHAKFRALRTPECPFTNLPLEHASRYGQGMTKAVMRTVTWLRPELVAQVKFAEWTRDGLLRQPVFLGLREDKSSREVRREKTAAV